MQRGPKLFGLEDHLEGVNLAIYNKEWDEAFRLLNAVPRHLQTQKCNLLKARVYFGQGNISQAINCFKNIPFDVFNTLDKQLFIKLSINQMKFDAVEDLLTRYPLNGEAHYLAQAQLAAAKNEPLAALETLTLIKNWQEQDEPLELAISCAKKASLEKSLELFLYCASQTTRNCAIEKGFIKNRTNWHNSGPYSLEPFFKTFHTDSDLMFCLNAFLELKLPNLAYELCLSFKELNVTSSDNVRSVLNLAEMFREHHFPDYALRLLSILPLSNSSQKILKIKAYCYADLGQHEEALLAMNKATHGSVRINVPNRLLWTSNQYSALGKLSEAYRNIQRTCPKSSTTANNSLLTLLAIKHEDWDRAITASGSTGKNDSLKGLLFSRKGDHVQALEYFGKSGNKEPNPDWIRSLVAMRDFDSLSDLLQNQPLEKCLTWLMQADTASEPDAYPWLQTFIENHLNDMSFEEKKIGIGLISLSAVNAGYDHEAKRWLDKLDDPFETPSSAMAYWELYRRESTKRPAPNPIHEHYPRNPALLGRDLMQALRHRTGFDHFKKTKKLLSAPDVRASLLYEALGACQEHPACDKTILREIQLKYHEDPWMLTRLSQIESHGSLMTFESYPVDKKMPFANIELPLHVKNTLKELNTSTGSSHYLRGSALWYWVSGDHDAFISGNFDVTAMPNAHNQASRLEALGFKDGHDRLQKYDDSSHTHWYIDVQSSYIEEYPWQAFTINRVYADANGHAYDPSGCGIQDIKEKRLRILSDNAKALQDDPFKIMSAMKYALRGFKLDAPLEQAIIQWPGHVHDSTCAHQLIETFINLLEMHRPDFQEMCQHFGLLDKLTQLAIRHECTSMLPKDLLLSFHRTTQDVYTAMDLTMAFNKMRLIDKRLPSRMKDPQEHTVAKLDLAVGLKIFFPSSCEDNQDIQTPSIPWASKFKP